MNLRKHSSVKCILRLNHISACVATRFKGQSWMRHNEDWNPGLLDWRNCDHCLITFPSIEGVIYLLRKKGWLTAAELALEDEE